MSAVVECPSCGTEVAGGAKFCRNCGAAVEVTRADGGGGAPDPPPPPPPPPRAAPPSPPPRVGSPPAQIGAAKKRNGPLLALAAFAACLAIGGLAFGAVYLFSGDDSGTAGPAVDAAGLSTSFESEVDASPPPVDTGGDEAPASAPPTPLERGFPTDSRATMRADAEELLREFHQAVVEGEFRYAWSLLTARKRQAEAREKTFSGWKEAQATLTPYLLPEGIHAEIDGLEDDGVARIRVTGMGWTSPGSPCSEWSGLTWVRYEGGAWRYDPGYSTTAERRRRWQDRSDELLGVGC